MMSAAAAVPAVLPTFALHHDGSPDLNDPAVISGLPPDLRVQIADIDHLLIKATPCLSWRDVPGAAATDPPIARSISQSSLDLLCVLGGFASPWLRSKDNTLLLSNVPAHANGMFTAWVGSGGLDLSVVYNELDQLLDAIVAAKLAVGSKDNRLVLEQSAFFEDESRPAGGPGSALNRAWMYAFDGNMLVGVDDGDTRAYGVLRNGVQPKMLSAGRDAVSNNYCRVLSSLRSISASQSSLVASALSDGATPNKEAAEYVADLWVRMVGTGYPFRLEGNMVHRNLELSRAGIFLNGSESEREAAFKQMFPSLSIGKRLVLKCVQEDGVPQDSQLMVSNFEQLMMITIYLKGKKWLEYAKSYP
jgi:hypothetical protein